MHTALRHSLAYISQARMDVHMSACQPEAKSLHDFTHKKVACLQDRVLVLAKSDKKETFIAWHASAALQRKD